MTVRNNNLSQLRFNGRQTELELSCGFKSQLRHSSDPTTGVKLEFLFLI